MLAALEIVTEKELIAEVSNVLATRGKQRTRMTASWHNEKVKAKRMIKNMVICGVVEYKSFRDAWAASFQDSVHIHV